MVGFVTDISGWSATQLHGTPNLLLRAMIERDPAVFNTKTQRRRIRPRRDYGVTPNVTPV